MKIGFLLPGGRTFRHFDMPAVPRKGERVLMGDNLWEVKEVAFILTGVSETEITIVLQEVS